MGVGPIGFLTNRDHTIPTKPVVIDFAKVVAAVNRSTHKDTTLSPELTSTFIEGSLGNQEDINKAIEIIARGGVASLQFSQVFGVWARADDQAAVNRALVEVKGKEKGAPMVAMMSSHDFLELVDVSQIHSDLQDLVKKPQDFQDRLGSIAIVAAPVKPERVKDVPPTLMSVDENGRHIMLNLDPAGNEGVQNFINTLNKSGIRYIGCSSLNTTGDMEIYEERHAKDFIKDKPVEIFLTDPSGVREGVRGSFPIISLVNASVVRAGHIPNNILNVIIGVELNVGGMKKANYEHHKAMNAVRFIPKDAKAWRNFALSVVRNDF